MLSQRNGMNSAAMVFLVWSIVTASLIYGECGITGSSTWDGYSRVW